MTMLQCVIWIVLITSYPEYTPVECYRHYDQSNKYVETLRSTTYENDRVPWPEPSDGQRVNQRSIPVENNHRSFPEENVVTKEDDREPRYQNGSFRILNNVYKSRPSIQQRRGIDDRTNNDDDDKVLFPGPTIERRSALPEMPQIPEECKSLGVCESVPNYPEDHAEEIIKKLGDDANKFKIDELLGPTVAQRNGLPEEEELCSYRETIYYPQAAQAKDGKWHFILNRKNKPLQGFRVEICRTTESCKSSIVFLPSSYKSRCKQKNVLRHMTAFENGKLIEKNFLLPSCCSCVVTANDDY